MADDSESSDSDIDLDEAYPDPVIPAAHHGEVTPAGQSDLVTSGDNHQAVDTETHAEDLTRDLVDKITSQPPRQSVDIQGSVGTVSTGPVINVHYPSVPSFDSQSPSQHSQPPALPPIIIPIPPNGGSEQSSINWNGNGVKEEDEKTKQEKLYEQVIDLVREFYQPTFLEWRQLHWSSGQRDFCVELVVRQTSAGREASLKKEFQVKEIFTQSTGETRRRHCILVEGHPGYGKTTLAKNIAVDWGNKADYTKDFKLVVFISCRDLKGRTLEQYVADTFPKHEDGHQCVLLKEWYYRPKDILFILDGLDECNNTEDSKTINELLQNRIYTGSHILATTRPLDDLQTLIHVRHFTTMVSIKGFNRAQIERIIDEHFKDRQGVGERMKEKLFDGNRAYQQLVSCPLLCQLFCLLWRQDERFPEKVTEVYYNLIHRLIRRESMEKLELIPDKTLPTKYEQVLQDFGKMCIQALKSDKLYFTKEEINKIVPESIRHNNANVIMGFLIKSNVSFSRSRDTGDCYQPLHKTFLEFVAAYYLRKTAESSENKENFRQVLLTLEEIDASSLEQILLYTVEMLQDKAHIVLKELGDMGLSLNGTGNLRLLNAAGSWERDNIEALTSVMDLQSVSVRCSLKEIDAWNNICVKSDVIKTLTFRWDPQCDALREEKVDNFFQKLLTKNTGIENIKMEFFHGELKSITDPKFPKYFLEEVNHFAHYLSMCMRKSGLKSFEVQVQVIKPPEDIKDSISNILIEQIVRVFRCKDALRKISLKNLKLDMDLGTDHLEDLVNAVGSVRSLKKLSLFKISSEARGFQSLADLILKGNILELELSLNVTKHWRTVRKSMTEDHNVCVGSPDMFQFSMAKLGEAVFDQTEDGITLTDDTRPGPTLGKLRNIIAEMKNVLSEGDEELSAEEGDYYFTSKAGVIYPLPLWNGNGRRESGFHHLFTALKDSRCRLQSFHLNHCLLSKEVKYLCSLAEVISTNSTLTRLKIDNMMPDREVQSSMPLFMSLTHNTSITELDLSCLENVCVNMTTFKMLSHCLSENKVLKILNLSGWKFELPLNSEAMTCTETLFEKTNLSHVVLSETEFCLNCKDFNTAFLGIPAMFLMLKNLRIANNSIEVLNLDSILIHINNVLLKSSLLVSILRFTSLKELDISEAAKPKFLEERDVNFYFQPDFHDSEECLVKDEPLVNFFRNLKENFSSLEVLKMVNWKIKLDNAPTTAIELKKCFKSLHNIKTISLNNVELKEPLFLKSLIKYLPQLEKLSLLRAPLSEDQVPSLMRALKVRVRRGPITLHTKHVMHGGHEELLLRLGRTRALTYQYNSLHGVLDIKPPQQTNMIKRFKSKLCEKM